MSVDHDGEIVTSTKSCAVLGFVVAALALIADQAHKFWMLDVFGIVQGDRVPVFPFLDLVYLKNTGVSYGWFSLDSFEGQLALSSFAVVASIALAVWMTRISTKLMATSLGLIIGGAIGNAIDRLRLGGVADFFSFHIGSFSWYVFNIADVAIVAGVIGILYDALVVSRKSASNSA